MAKNRAFYDWQRFNKKHFAEWHGWLSQTLKKNLPDIPTHAKIMVFFTMDRDKMGYGVDPEEFTDATDLAGCDAYAFPDGDHQSYDWRGEEFWYDLLNSFHNQPVFNSENHVIPDGTPPVHIPMTMTRAQFWQGALHHQGVTTTWVWEEARDPSLSGSIFFRPANAYGAGRAFVDLGHFAPEVAAINQAPAQVALLYSQPSIFWEEKYAAHASGHVHPSEFPRREGDVRQRIDAAKRTRAEGESYRRAAGHACGGRHSRGTGEVRRGRREDHSGGRQQSRVRSISPSPRRLKAIAGGRANVLKFAFANDGLDSQATLCAFAEQPAARSLSN